MNIFYFNFIFYILMFKYFFYNSFLIFAHLELKKKVELKTSLFSNFFPNFFVFTLL